MKRLEMRRAVRNRAEPPPVLAELSGLGAGEEDGALLDFGGPQIEGFSSIFEDLGIAGAGLVVLTAVAGCVPDARIAIGMATTAAVRGASTVIIDTDLERRALAPALRLEPAPGLAEYVAGEAEARDVLQVVELAGEQVQRGSRIACVCAGARPAAAEDPSILSQVDHVLGRLRRAYDVAVVLGPALDRPVGEWIIDRADAVLVVADRRSRGRRGRTRMAAASSLLRERRAGLLMVVAD